MALASARVIPAGFVAPCVASGRIHVVYRLARVRSQAGQFSDVVDRPATVIQARYAEHDGRVSLTCWRLGTEDGDGLASQHLDVEHDPSGQIPGTWRWPDPTPAMVVPLPDA